MNATGEGYSPQGEELDVRNFLDRRIPVLKDTKKRILGTIDFEQIMKDADNEYQPAGLNEKSNKGIMLVQDEVKGLRGSRIVKIGDDTADWRSNVSEPTLFVKIQTALSILIDQNPEAIFKATLDRYKSTTVLAHAMWKRSWDVAKSKQQLKLFVFDLMKYGWSIGYTYPRLERRNGQILRVLDVENPEKNEYDEKEITEYNDVFRRKLDPYKTWIDDMTNLTDPFSMDDWYREEDYSWDRFQREFGDYENAKYVKAGVREHAPDPDTEEVNEETKKRDDIVTVGFYEGKNKDLYAIRIPAQNIILYYSPLPNDEKKLSCWWTYWNIRDPRTPYGIGLYELLRNNKVLYDRLDNMDIDSLTLAIYSMLFYSGPAGAEDIVLSPGLIKQKLAGTTIDQIKLQYGGKGREGAQQQMERIDEVTGINPLLQGQVEGKTLGEVLHAKDAALKRLNIPLSNIAEAMEMDAYISLSWMNQIYSVPEVREFTELKELEAYEKEIGRQAVDLTSQRFSEEGNPIALDRQALAAQSEPFMADFYPSLELSLDTDDQGNLVESPEARFFNIGHDTEKSALRWEGRITIKPQSVIAPSQELERQRKIEVFNVVMPVVEKMAMLFTQGMKQVALALYKPVKQILEIQDEKPQNWLPDELVVYAEMTPQERQQVDQMEAQQAAAAAQAAAPIFQSPEEAAAGGLPAAPSAGAPKADTVVPRNEVSNPMRKTLGEMGKAR